MNEIVDINVIRDKATSKFAKRDIAMMEREGEMAITETKYGVLWCKYSDGIFSFDVTDGIKMKNLFTGNKQDGFEFLKNCYTFEINENFEQTQDKAKSDKEAVLLCHAVLVNYEKLLQTEKGFPHTSPITPAMVSGYINANNKIRTALDHIYELNESKFIINSFRDLEFITNELAMESGVIRYQDQQNIHHYIAIAKDLIDTYHFHNNIKTGINETKTMNINELRRIIFENYLDAGANESYLDVNEIDVVDQDNPAESNITASPISGTEKKFETLTPEDKQRAVNEINKARKTGKSNITFDIYAAHKQLFLYFTDTLAILHNSPGVTESEKNNIRNVLWAIFYPSNPKIYRQLLTALSYAGAYLDAQSIEDIVVEGAMSALKYILGTKKTGEPVYNPMYSFSNTFLHYAKKRSIDIWNKNFRNKTIASGMGGEDNSLVSPEKKINFNQSIDQVYGDTGDDADDALRLKDTLASSGDEGEQRMKSALARKIWEPLVGYIERMLEKSIVSTKIFDYIVKDGIKLSKAIEKKFQEGNITNNKGKIPTETDINVYKKRIGEEILGRLESHDIDKYISTVTKEPVDLSQLARTIQKRGKTFPLELLQIDNFINLVLPIISEEQKISYAKILAEKNKTRVEKIVSTYESFNNLINKNTLQEGQEVATLDMYEHIKGFVTNATAAINEAYNDLEQLTYVAHEVQGEFPDAAQEIRLTVQNMVEALFSYPEKLKRMLAHLSQKYNAKKYYGDN